MVSFLFYWVRQLQNAKGFSLAQCFLWWWGKPAENTERCTVIGSVFCHSWGLNVNTKSKGRGRKFKPLGCCHRVTLEVPIQEGSRSLATDKIMSNHIISTVALIGLLVVGNRKFHNEWFGRNQWLTASIAKLSLACYSVEWLRGPKSKIKGLFS